ncbi:MAG: hypothetical protein CMH61_01185 [Nanoarchaeota archaeon]|nr:hypothetical protein [Nanoarchaeota archaeon]|tara:strand:- start:4409 stop:4627 length:219 start_codon:yes stop_codon:yes gene_type:complete
MVNMTLSIPEDLHKEMTAHSEIKWSVIARKAFENKVEELHWMDKVVQNSTFTKEDAEEIGHKIKHEVAKRFR